MRAYHSRQCVFQRLVVGLSPTCILKMNRMSIENTDTPEKEEAEAEEGLHRQ